MEKEYKVPKVVNIYHIGSSIVVFIGIFLWLFKVISLDIFSIITFSVMLLQILIDIYYKLKYKLKLKFFDYFWFVLYLINLISAIARI